MKKKLILAALSMLSCVIANAQDCELPTGFVFVETGGSFSRQADVKVDFTFWDQSPEGYNATLDQVPFFGFGLGYYINNWLSVAGQFNRRASFKYSKCQTPTVTDTPGFLGNKTRLFQLDNTSFMVGAFFNRTGAFSCFTYEFCNGMGLAPYVGAGIGFSQNHLYNFRSVTEQTTTLDDYTNNGVGSIMTDSSRLSFSWQVAGGVSLYLNCCAYLNFGYRYFDGGKFKSNNFIIPDNVAGANQGIIVPAWQGKLRAHEFVVSLNLAL